MLARLKRRSHRFKARALQAIDRARFAAPLLKPVEKRAVEALKETGVFVTSLDELGIPFGAAMDQDLDALISEVDALVRDRSERKLFVRVSTPEVIARYPRVIRFGLDETLLNVAEGYLRMPVLYRGVMARVDAADGRSGETRCWHLDAEDFRIAKAIIYLNDVGPLDGPLEYIPGKLGPAISEVKLTNHRVNDDDMAAVVPRDHWVACTGPAGTLILVDTCTIWHRGRPPTGNRRHTLIYAYNGPQPLNPHYCEAMFPVDAFARSQSDLSARQRSRLMLA